MFHSEASYSGQHGRLGLLFALLRFCARFSSGARSVLQHSSDSPAVTSSLSAAPFPC